MITQNTKNKPLEKPHNRIDEIGKILAIGIYRLYNKNLQNKEQKELDSNSLLSVHTVNNNLNLQDL